jgi:uncharacterized protein YjlB
MAALASQEDDGMPIVEDLKRVVEKLTGIGRPLGRDAERLAWRPRPEVLRFRDDGRTPNNPRLPLVVYRQAIRFEKAYDPAAVIEDVFARHGWRDSWRDSIYDFLHFHTATHEVLGIARGRVTIRFGGSSGRNVSLKAGDVVVLPAGTGHCRLRASRDLMVVGAYPAEGRYDEPRPGEIDAAEARKSIAKVPRPRQDPVYGSDGPLLALWKLSLTPRQRQRVRARRAKAPSA